MKAKVQINEEKNQKNLFKKTRSVIYQIKPFKIGEKLIFTLKKPHKYPERANQHKKPSKKPQKIKNL